MSHCTWREILWPLHGLALNASLEESSLTFQGSCGNSWEATIVSFVVFVKINIYISY